MASIDDRVVDDVVVPANAGSPASIPAVIMEICHDCRVDHYEYVNHARPDLQCELWLVVLLGTTKWHTVNFTSYSKRTEEVFESGLHGSWAPLPSSTDCGLPGLRLYFDYEGRFGFDCLKECDFHRGGPTCPHRQKGYDYAGVDYMTRMIWLKLLHSFTLMNSLEQGVQRTRRGALREDDPPPPPPGLSPGSRDCCGTAAPSMID